MRSLPIRVRLTVPFAVAMAAMLAGLGLFVYAKVGGTLLRSVDDRLRAEVADAVSHGPGDQGLLDADVRGSNEPAQVLDAHGRVLRSSPPGLRPLIGVADVGSVLRGATVLRSTDLPGRQDERRLLAAPIHKAQARVLVVTESLEPRDAALDHLFRDLLLVGPIALVLAGLAGYGLAAAALRPVEAMRRRAAAISAETPGRRLPVPRGDDEVQRLAETLNEMIARLEAAFEHERRFVSDASHELRTPLALLRAELELALRRPRTHDELEAAVRSAAEETERLTRLAEDLLFIARADQGRVPVRRGPVEAATSLEATAERFAARANELGRQIVVQPGPELTLDADVSRLEQALGNLVENALVHGTGTIRLTTREAGDLVELHVVDEGPGFAPGFAARAFDRFAQADDARSAGGAGLGLAIVDLIARAHGGSAGVSEEPDGADVWIAVPISHGVLMGAR